MNVEQVRLFELQLKGERLDAANAEEIMARRAATAARMVALSQSVRAVGQHLGRWMVTIATNKRSTLPNRRPAL